MPHCFRLQYLGVICCAVDNWNTKSQWTKCTVKVRVKKRNKTSNYVMWEIWTIKLKCVLKKTPNLPSLVKFFLKSSRCVYWRQPISMLCFLQHDYEYHSSPLGLEHQGNRWVLYFLTLWELSAMLPHPFLLIYSFLLYRELGLNLADLVYKVKNPNENQWAQLN